MRKLVFGVILATSLNSFAQSATKNEPVKADDMRCSKLMGKTLSEFKEDLVQYCDLNKPYSTSLSRMMNDETYFYCCHKKK